MAQRGEPPFRADQVGSLRRPEALRQARERLLGPHDLDHNFGPHNNAELRAIEDQCIREAVAMQENTGIRSITDGEFRRRIWWSEFLLSLDGVEGNYRGPTTDFRDRAGHLMPAPRIDVTGKIRWRKSVNLEPFKFLKSVSRQTPKVTIPAPQSLYFATTPDSINRDVYPDLSAFWEDLAIAYRAELAALGAAGCTYVQLDEVMTSCLCDERQRAKWRARGDEPEKLLRTYGQAINRLLEGRPPAMRVAIHTCRGNLQGHWLAEGGYDPIAEYLFNEIAADAFFLEYDSERAGGFEPLRFVPAGKTVVLGLVSTKTPELEPEDQIAARIEAAAKFIPLDQLCLSPQCGFSSNYLGNPVTIDDQRRKLELVVKVARKVWGSA
ncbi:MAG TPA: 5-methyltetrahydropteroyltriglutamate--homocysteine S-methyltransferase [Candidatus Binataceae bacterium]|nr:5-methyltetrahydropteroyltriglutamate--homocysteine S-methyltransferase [Candidatus Binataceae bacterium]